MKDTNRNPKKLELKDIMQCLDILCRASAAVVEKNPELSNEIMTATEILTLACNTETKKIEEYYDDFTNNSKKFKKIEEETITDLFSGEVIYQGTS